MRSIDINEYPSVSKADDRKHKQRDAEQLQRQTDRDEDNPQGADSLRVSYHRLRVSDTYSGEE